MHAAWNKRCVELLDGLRSRWFEGCDEGARVGAVAARVATELLDEELSGGTHGIWISATHGSVDETYATQGSNPTLQTTPGKPATHTSGPCLGQVVGVHRASLLRLGHHCGAAAAHGLLRRGRHGRPARSRRSRGPALASSVRRGGASHQLLLVPDH
jgi:hypothetical protein